MSQECATLGFAGQYLDSRTGLYDMRARDYDPTTGRFTTTDPITIPVGTPSANGYSYSWNNPMKYTDASGEFPGCAGEKKGQSGFCDSLDFLTGEAAGAADMAKAVAFGAAAPMLSSFMNATRVYEGCSDAYSLWGSDSYGLTGTLQCLDVMNPISSIRDGFQASFDSADKGCYFDSGREFSPSMIASVGILDGAASGLRSSMSSRLSGSVTASAPAAEAGGSVLSFGSKAAARAGLPGDLASAGNRFFRGATAKSQGFQAVELPGGGYRMQFFSPADNPGYGKLYVQEIDGSGQVLREYKDTIGPDGKLIERKWVHGGP